MEEEVCMYQKFGHCKYKEGCLKNHLQETCQDGLACDKQKSCQKRHPKGCKGYAMDGFCRFGDGCSYHHQEHKTINSEMNIKVETLEKTLHEMAAKINELEDKIKEMESKNSEESKHKEADKRVEENKNVSKQNEIIKKKSQLKQRNNSVFKFGPEARKTVLKKDESKKVEQISKAVKCEICDYMCEKQSTLKKHINSKHTEQKCDLCGKECMTSMEIITHKANEHHEEVETFNVEIHSTPKEDKEKKESSFKFSESMLDEFL
jgi:hypothetical protein